MTEIAELGSVNLPARFWSKVTPEPTSGCWLWLGGDNAVGYGRIWDEIRQYVIYAHRYAYERLVGAIPRDRIIDHLCRVPCCVNPKHMELVTKAENINRSPKIIASRASATCTNGHLWSDRNEYINKKGCRICRACSRERMRNNRKKRCQNQ